MKVYIDHNVWDELFRLNLDLESCFPSAEFTLSITQHGKYEVEQTPEHCNTLKEYIYKYLGFFVQVDSFLGFHNPGIPNSEQRTSGFGIGQFSSITDENFRKELNEAYGSNVKRKPSQILNKQEADIELGVRALRHPVLTLDIKQGPLQKAFEKGGKVILLDRQLIQNLSGNGFVNHIKERLTDIQT